MIGVRIIVRAIRGRATGQATSNRSSRCLPETRARRGFFVSAQGAPPPAIAGTKEFRMCSILGAFDLRPGADLAPLRPLALSLSARQRHRGPDWSGVPASRRALLVHARLAILAPAGGAPPIRCAAGTLVLAVTCAIYNHHALAHPLPGAYHH